MIYYIPAVTIQMDHHNLQVKTISPALSLHLNTFYCTCKLNNVLDGKRRREKLKPLMAEQ